MQTRKYPRTLQEAFGPYTSHEIMDHDTDYSPQWWVAFIAVAILSVITVVVTA